MRFLRRMLGLAMFPYPSNEEVRRFCHVEDTLSQVVKRNHLRWLGHVLRMQSDRIPRRIFFDKQPAPLDFDNPDATDCWFVQLEWKLHAKGLEKQVTYLFFSKCGIPVLRKLKSLARPNSLEKMEYAVIKKLILHYIHPSKRILITDRTNFMVKYQKNNESELDYLTTLKHASLTLKDKHYQPKTELIKMKFVSGLRDSNLKLKLLEHLVSQLC
jgi:hypothetical protein